MSTTEKLQLPPLQTVDYVDLQRYTGTWYEIANFPHRFQEGCTGTTATYSLRDDNQIKVVNRCFKDSLDGVEDIFGFSEESSKGVENNLSLQKEVRFREK